MRGKDGNRVNERLREKSENENEIDDKNKSVMMKE